MAFYIPSFVILLIIFSSSASDSYAFQVEFSILITPLQSLCIFFMWYLKKSQYYVVYLSVWRFKWFAWISIIQFIQLFINSLYVSIDFECNWNGTPPVQISPADDIVVWLQTSQDNYKLNYKLRLLSHWKEERRIFPSCLRAQCDFLYHCTMTIVQLGNTVGKIQTYNSHISYLGKIYGAVELLFFPYIFSA